MPTTLPYTFSDGPGNTASGVQVTANDQALANAIDALLPSGMLMPTARSTAPAGWLLCDGAAVSRTTYAALFSALGTTYGAGDGSTTFNLPDVKGRTLVGKGAHASVDTLGESDGAADAGRSPKHSHGHTLIGAVAIRLNTGAFGGENVATSNATGTLSSQAATMSGTIGDTTGPSNGPAYLTVNYLVKT